MNIEFEIAPDTETVRAVYVRIRDGEVSRTVEVEPDICFADLDATGELLGVEFLGRWSHVDMDRILRGPGAQDVDHILEMIRESVVSLS